jgi:hypothetical protein
VDFDLPREIKMMQGLLRKFVDQELIPIEMQVNLDEELDESVLKPLQEKVKALGLWQLDVPKEYGGLGFGMLARCVVQEEISRTKALPFRHNDLFGPTVGPILYLCNDEQKERFLWPTLRGEITVAFAQTEPDSGADASDGATFDCDVLGSNLQRQLVNWSGQVQRSVCPASASQESHATLRALRPASAVTFITSSYRAPEPNPTPEPLQ